MTLGREQAGVTKAALVSESETNRAYVTPFERSNTQIPDCRQEWKP